MKPKAASPALGLLWSVALAALLWIALALGKRYENQQLVSLKWDDELAAAWVTEDWPATAMYRIKSSGWNLLWLSLKNPQIHLSSTPNLGENAFIDLMDPSLKRQVFGAKVDLLSAQPDKISLLQPGVNSVKVPVQLRAEWLFKEGYGALSRAVLQPDSVQVQGPSVVLDTLQSWPSLPINAEDISQTITRSVDLQPGGALGIRTVPNKVNLSMEVDRFTEAVLSIPVSVPVATGLSTVPDRVDLHFRVALSQYGQISASDFRLEADLQHWEHSGSRWAELKMTRSPEALEVLHWYPQSVEVFYSHGY